MGAERVMDSIREKVRDGIESLSTTAGHDILLVIGGKHLISAVGTLKNDPALGFSTLMNHLGVDLGDRMAVVYNLYSPSLRQRLTVKVHLDRDRPEVESLTRAFPGISWFERETYEMLGIRFLGHGNLKRLLLPEDWEGYPLRKDYVYPEQYHGMDLGRSDLLEEPDPGEEDRV